MTIKVHSASTLVSAPLYPISGGASSRLIHAEQLNNWAAAIETYHNANVDKLMLHDMAITDLQKQINEMSKTIQDLYNYTVYVADNYPHVTHEYNKAQQAKARMDV